MTEKEVRRLSRAELLVARTEECERLSKKLSETEAALASRRIAIDNAGSIAEAALALNDVFRSAQNAAEQYPENLRDQYLAREEIPGRAQAEAREQAERILQEARDQADRIRKEAEAYSEQLHATADRYWSDALTRPL